MGGYLKNIKGSYLESKYTDSNKNLKCNLRKDRRELKKIGKAKNKR